MSTTRSAVRAAAKAIAQDAGPGNTATGVQLLLTDPGDYNIAIAQALRTFGQDRPNQRTFDYTATAAGFRFDLNGGSSILPTNQSPPSVPSAALAGAGAGNVDNGDHTYRVTFIHDAAGEQETQASGQSAVVTVADKTIDGQVNVTLPALPSGYAGWKVYRCIANDTSGDHLLVGTQLSGAGTTFVDSIADSNLGAAAPEQTTDVDPDAWVNGRSYMTTIWFPYVDTDQDATPLENNDWRTIRKPAGIVSLELIGLSAIVNDVLRLEYISPHVLNESNDPGATTILDGDVDAFNLLAAVYILTLAANKAVQNTGNTGLPGDVVDRRTQSDQFRSRAKELMGFYNTLVGKGDPGELKAASGFLDLDAEPSWRSYGLGDFLLHSKKVR